MRNPTQPSTLVLGSLRVPALTLALLCTFTMVVALQPAQAKPSRSCITLPAELMVFTLLGPLAIAGRRRTQHRESAGIAPGRSVLRWLARRLRWGCRRQGQRARP